jgi:hypothetical protein
MTLQERYEDLVDEFAGAEGITLPPGGSGFGRGALRYRGKIFAMFVRGQLVVKLPRDRVDELVADGQGVRFDANKGTPMKEWFSLDPDSALAWLPLARAALDFAGGGLAGPPPSQAATQPAQNLSAHRLGPGQVGKSRTASDKL